MMNYKGAYIGMIALFLCTVPLMAEIQTAGQVKVTKDAKLGDIYNYSRGMT